MGRRGHRRGLLLHNAPATDASPNRAACTHQEVPTRQGLRHFHGHRSDGNAILDHRDESQSGHVGHADYDAPRHKMGMEKSLG